MGHKAIIFDWIGTLYEREKGLFPDSRRVLDNLQGRYRLALVSKRRDPEQGLEEVRNEGIAKYFNYILIARRKTLAEFKKCIRQLSLKPEEIIVVGDRTIREIRIGNQLGCITYWINKGEHAEELPTRKTGQPDSTISSISDLLVSL